VLEVTVLLPVAVELSARERNFTDLGERGHVRVGRRRFRFSNLRTSYGLDPADHDASVAAGPKGRDASANTDAWMRAEILSYSRSRGLFAGISLEGSTLRPDDDASADVYGHPIKAKDIVRGTKMIVPATGRHLVNALQKSAPHNESERASN